MAKSLIEILQFNFNFIGFKESGEKVISIPLLNLKKTRISTLKNIEEKLPNLPTPPSLSIISDVYKKFKSSIQTKKSDFTKRELRLLTYSLNYTEKGYDSIIYNISEIDYLFELLNSDWRDSYLTGLIDCFMKNWDSSEEKSIMKLERFLIDKLDNYKGNRKAILAFKKNKRYFNSKNGDIILGDALVRLNMSILDATKVLSVPDSWFSYPYFSRVIAVYYEKNRGNISETIEYITDVLIKHNNTKTAKKVISRLIIEIDSLNSTELKDKIKSIAFKQIGDPGNIACWAIYNNATEDEKIELSKARDILNLWITQQFISVFFNVCINDYRRMKFWLKYSSKISSFKVYGPESVKKQLKRDNRISEYVDSRFNCTTSRRNVSAFILYIGDYMLIEFSSEGYAFYAYKLSSINIPKLQYKLDSVDELRNKSIPMAIDFGQFSTTYNDEGRLHHRDGLEEWESRFGNWLRSKVFK